MATLWAADSSTDPAPASDRVGFPKDYQAKYEVLRTFVRTKEMKIVTVYGNAQAASVTNAAQLPYPYGSVFVMETSEAVRDAEDKPVLDAKGEMQKGKVAGLHVMRREKNFGEAYAKNRTAEWEYVEYAADGSYITPAAKSAACAACHVKAGADRDFVYRGRFPALAAK